MICSPAQSKARQQSDKVKVLLFIFRPTVIHPALGVSHYAMMQPAFLVFCPILPDLEFAAAAVAVAQYSVSLGR